MTSVGTGMLVTSPGAASTARGPVNIKIKLFTTGNVFVALGELLMVLGMIWRDEHLHSRRRTYWRDEGGGLHKRGASFVLVTRYCHGG